MDIGKLYDLYRQHPCITTDSRHCPPGSIFLALKGETFNGNDYAAKALENGCAYAIVDEADKAGGDNIILVDNCLQTYKDLARMHRRQFDIPVLAITGTNGKTTTKELIAAVLGSQYNVLFTEANYNNDVGVPKTLFRLAPEHEIAVIEMGASHPGDIKTLVETAEPTCGLITNVGRAHLQGFGSFEGVKRTKGELYDFLADRQTLDPTEEGMPMGFVFINDDDDDLRAMADERELIFQFGYGTGDNEEISVKGRLEKADPYVSFSWWFSDEDGDTEHNRVDTHLIGTYNIHNLLAAVAVGICFDVDNDNICRALADYVPSNNRSQLEQTAHNRLVVDAYNANPTSMAAAIDNFCHISHPHKMLILGDMKELGADSETEHQRVADMVARCQAEEVWLVGPEFAKTQCEYRKLPDTEAVAAAIGEHQPQGRLILIKGSHSMRLDKLVELL
ncbi:MAG: UDP-N-acetylmuramoyl-tripeptide--D-alanyl-D-alanine ligase [Prevotella sp.]|nr:UDP-N-acetylmuramoyl-tripeptide--D-alanyl-D-alanine ligase [Prevotella sp.]